MIRCSTNSAACGSVTTEAVSTPEPVLVETSAPTATPERVDPAAVVQGFWDAMEAGDIDLAMTFLAEDIKCRGSCYMTGQASVQPYLEGLISSEQVTEISDLVVEGDKVTYTFKVIRSGQQSQHFKGEVMYVQDGKIVLWENIHA